MEPAVWDAVQEKMKVYKELEETLGHRGGQPHFLFGKVFCGECGEPMTRRTVNGVGGAKCKTWVCRSKRRGKGCGGRNVKEDEILAAGMDAEKIVVTREGIEVA